MRILRHYRDCPIDAKGAVVALGNFDGVHLGHRALLLEAKRLAREQKRPFGAIVFEPNPREFFRPNDEPFRLTPFRAKARLLSDLGVDLHGDPVFVIREVGSYGVLTIEEFILGHHRLEDQRFDLADPGPDGFLSFVHDAHGIEFILKETLDYDGVIDLQIGKVHCSQV